MSSLNWFEVKVFLTKSPKQVTYIFKAILRKIPLILKSVVKDNDILMVRGWLSSKLSTAGGGTLVLEHVAPSEHEFPVT